ncbi:MAG: restriction endonuclease subunit S [Syntrophales bacterium]
MSETILYNCDVPPGWTIIDFNKACDKISLNEIKIKQKEYLAEGTYPVVDQGQELIGGYFNEKEFVIPLNPPYIVFGDHTKVKKYINFRFIAGADGIKVLKSKEFYNSKLLFYFLHVIKIPDKGYARHFQFLEKSEIPLPPSHEQHRIVAKIEELFSELDKGVEALKTAQQQLKVYRQAVLKRAFEGKLTNKNIVEGELPEGWKWVKLEDICDPNRKCSYGVLVPGDHIENGITLLRVGDIDDCGRINQYNMKKISPMIANKFKRTFLEGGEVVISLVGAIGRTAVVPIALKGANTARAVGVIPVSSIVDAKYVEAMLRSPNKIREHNDSSHEVARKTLNLEDLVKSKIPFPPTIEEQQAIVAEIETRLSVADKLEGTITQSLQQAEALRQSILEKAFAGKLVPQDPNDEPASKLLERIKVERATQMTVKGIVRGRGKLI